ncbi:MAG TPA: hypothetical protein VMG09_00920 [Bacteroidota bacterium]|nr:hypothetical protein [Bacteroidota bacterium]
MTLDELKTAVNNLTVEERRKLAVFILDLEKEHLKNTIGPQISEDLQALSKVLQDAAEKIKRTVKGSF